MSNLTEALEGRFAGLTYIQIAEKIGISRQRVQQLISPPPYIRKLIVDRADGKCEICGLRVNGSGHVHHKSCKGEDYNDTDNLQLLCQPCHRKEHAEKHPCPYCGKVINKSHIFCNWNCFQGYNQKRKRIYNEATMKMLQCSCCGKEFIVYGNDASQRVKRNQSGRFFCSKQCQGRLMGRENGFLTKQVGGCLLL